MALKYFVRYYKHYLLGRKFVVRSDHESLKWLYSLKEPKHRIARWIEVLSEFDFELEYRPGRKHSNADAMSRCPNPRQCSCDVVVEHDLPCKACKKCLHRAPQGVMEISKWVPRPSDPHSQARCPFTEEEYGPLASIWQRVLNTIGV